MHRERQCPQALRVGRKSLRGNASQSLRRRQFVTDVAALPGNPYDGRTLAAIVPAIEASTGGEVKRILADRGYRGHDAPPTHRCRVFIQAQKRRVTDAIKRQKRRTRRRRLQLPHPPQVAGPSLGLDRRSSPHKN